MAFIPSKGMTNLRKPDSNSKNSSGTTKSNSKSFAEAPRVASLTDSSQGGSVSEPAIPTWDIVVSSVSRAGKIPMNPNKVNQDRVWVLDSLENKLAGFKFFGVADGHGVHGHDVSEMIKCDLPIFVSQQLLLKSSLPWLLQAAHLKMTNKISISDIDITFSGSTCVSVLLVSTATFGRKVICANIGDSRAILGSMVGGALLPRILSNDHKPDLPLEKKRIIAKRGRVSPYLSKTGEALGPARVWLKNQELPGLAMSRSFGDSVAATVGVISEPEIIELALSSSDKVLVIASDGVWEFLSNEDVLSIVSPFCLSRDAKGAAELLCQKAHLKWKLEEECIDDISAIVAFL